MDAMVKMHIHAGQITSEYALLTALIIFGLIGFQYFIKGSVQARVKDAVDYPMRSGYFQTAEFEPPFINSFTTMDSLSQSTAAAESDFALLKTGSYSETISSLTVISNYNGS